MPAPNCTDAMLPSSSTCGRQDATAPRPARGEPSHACDPRIRAGRPPPGVRPWGAATPDFAPPGVGGRQTRSRGSLPPGCRSAGQGCDFVPRVSLAGCGRRSAGQGCDFVPRGVAGRGTSLGGARLHFVPRGVAGRRVGRRWAVRCERFPRCGRAGRGKAATSPRGVSPAGVERRSAGHGPGRGMWTTRCPSTSGWMRTSGGPNWRRLPGEGAAADLRRSVRGVHPAGGGREPMDVSRPALGGGERADRRLSPGLYAPASDELRGGCCTPSPLRRAVGRRHARDQRFGREPSVRSVSGRPADLVDA